jgi:hypothetical protein
LWAKFYGGYANGALGDLNTSAAEWKTLLNNIVRVVAGSDGELVTAEFGVALDKTNGLAFDVTAGQYSSLAVAGGAATVIAAKIVIFGYQQEISPSFFSGELAYYHFFPLGRDNRFFVKGGGGLGLANANILEQSNYPAAYISYGRTLGPVDLSAFSPCLSGGLGWEWMAADGLGIEVSARGRYAVFSQLTGSAATTDPSGNVVNSGAAGLYKGPRGIVGLEYSNSASPSDSWANLDFSGFDMGLSVNAYFF